MKTLKKTTITHQQIKPPNASNSNPLSDFLFKHRVQKGDESRPITNTRIGNQELEIYGGKYSIPDDKYADFLTNQYYREVFQKQQPEYLTETQLEKGPLLVDIDLRHPYDITTRQYTLEHITDLVGEYLATFKESFQIDDEAVIHTYLFQKPTVNRVANDKITKDGAHLIFSLHLDHIAQQLIRTKILEKIPETWQTELNTTNSWDKVFDEGISKGTTNWQLVGSRKPGNESYRLTGIFTSTFDSMEEEFTTDFADASTFNMATDIFKLSARYPHHYEPFMTPAFLAEHTQLKENLSKPAERQRTQQPLTNRMILQEIDPLSISNHEELAEALKQFLDSIPPDRYNEYEAYSYTMTLPNTYYGPGSYDKWFQVGCALKNISKSLFIVWLAFSAQSAMFSFVSDVPNLWDQWLKFDTKTNGLTLRSIMYWSKKDALNKYKEVKSSSIDYYIEQTLDNGLSDFAVSDKKQMVSDWDLAKVLYHMKKDQYLCSSVKGNLWYRYKDHRWREIDSGTSLRTAISTELRALYAKKAEQLASSKSALEDDDPKYKYLQARMEKCLEIHGKLGRTADKKNIMTEVRDMFYDEEFDRKIDTNPHLLCVGNGIWDFKERKFREGKPEDYISMSTRIDYEPLSDKHDTIVEEIKDFFKKIFPVEELREYMWDHLASTLVGTALNQTFNNYLGGGRNGKSVVTSLMTKVLGDYKGELPLTAVTTKRTAVGGLAPEIAGLKGKRYVVMQEPTQKDVLNEGILKELTSGHDAIQARSLFSMPVSFLPQFKLIVCANILPEIRAQDHGTWRRIRVVPFMSLFTENPVEGDPYKPYQYKLDASIDEKFDSWKKVMLALLVDRVLKTNGRVLDCETVLKASNEYKQKQDVISQFIDDRIERAPGQWLSQTDANQGFKLWHEENFGSRGPQPKELHTALDRQFGEHIKKKGWRDIRLVFDMDTHTNEVDSDDASF
jgi:P4 family phage/plasmid primase-like protien